MARTSITRMAAGVVPSCLAAPDAGLALAAGEYHGNPTARVCHNSGCRHRNCKKRTVVFKSAKAARKAGYRARGIWKG